MSPLRKQASRAKKLDSHFLGNDKYRFRNRDELQSAALVSHCGAAPYLQRNFAVAAKIVESACNFLAMSACLM